MFGCWDWEGFMPHHGFGRRFGFHHGGHSRYFTREDEIRFWEEYQKDLEEELAGVTGRIERLKKAQQQTAGQQTAGQQQSTATV